MRSLVHDPVRRERIRRVLVLITVSLALVGGLFAFHARQSLVTNFNAALAARAWLPTLSTDVRPAANTEVNEAEAIPVLVYHGIVPKAESGNVTPEIFWEHMGALKSAGYKTVSLSEFQLFMKGRIPLPERSVLVTFDDGRTDSFAGADPVLRHFGFRATMFTILGNARSGKPFYLSVPETKMMAENGRWDVQSHTNKAHVYIPVEPLGDQGHALASRAWLADEARLESDREYVDRATGDLTEARDGISEITGSPVTAFAYPWGDHGQNSPDPLIRTRLREIAGKLYATTFRQASPTVEETYNHPSDDGSVLRRIYISYDMTAEDLMARLERGRVKSLPFADPALRSPGWVATVGGHTSAPDGAILTSSPGDENNRAEVFLDGSRAWDDYEMSTRFSLDGSETVSLIARRDGPRDYIAATVSRSYVSIEQVIGEKRTTLGEADVQLAADGRTVNDVNLSVVGQTARLSIGGRPLVEVSGLDPARARGGVALRVDPVPGSPAKLKLRGFRIDSSRNTFALSSDGASSAAPLKNRRSQ